MQVAFGMRAHSGWAALVVVGIHAGELRVVDRRRVELIERADAAWASAPYHAAEHLNSDEARVLVERGIASARLIAVRELRAAVARAREAGQRVRACAVLLTEPMPDWSVAEVLAVHFRMHKAEGVLFRDALARAAVECDLKLVGIQEKQFEAQAARILGKSLPSVRATIASLGKSVGPPWGKDQKDATLAAVIALHGRSSTS